MPKTLPFCQQQRQRTGNHTNWLDKRLGTQKTQNEIVQKLASRPGLHTKNISRQNTAHAMLQLISILSAVQYNSVKTTKYSIKSREACVLRNSTMSFSEHGYIKQTALFEKPITMLSWLTGLLYQADAFIIRNDPLRFPGAHALPIKENKTMNWNSSKQRKPRYVPLPTKSTPTAFVPDDIKVEKMYDFSCMNNGDDLSTAQIFRQIGKTLQTPITMMTKEIKNVASWTNGQGCASPETINAITNITKNIDRITSQIITLLPGSKPLAVLQYIVGPLLERAANDLEGKPTSLSEELALLQQINLETKMSHNMILDRDKEILKNIPTSNQKSIKVELPEFHIVDSNSKLHIDMETDGKAQRFPVTFNEKNGRIHTTEPIGTKGEVKLHQVYYNFMTKKWEKTGNGKFNHFSKKERRLAQKLGLQIQNEYPSNFNDKAATYSVLNPYFSEPKRLDVIMMFGHLVPYRYEPSTGKTFIYDASAPEKGELHEIVLAQGEWHLKTIPDRNIKIKTLYSPQHSKHLHVAVVGIKDGQEIFAQYNSETGYYFGEKFVLNNEGNDLEPLSSTKRQDRIYVDKNPDETPNEENLLYDEENQCYRVKRGIFHGKPLCQVRSNTRQDHQKALDRDNAHEFESDVDNVITTRENGLYFTTEPEYNDDIKIHSEDGLMITKNEQLNEAWTLMSVNIKNNNFNTANVVGSKIDVTFKLGYKAKARNARFKEMPQLEWNEIINFKDGDSKWRFVSDMHKHNPFSMTFFPWRLKYVEAYHYSKEKNKLSFNGNVKIYKDNMQPLEIKDIKEACSPIEMEKKIKRYLRRNAGIMEITISDLPQIGKRPSSNKKERLVEFSLGLNKKSAVNFRQGITLSSDGAAIVFVTTSKKINIAEGEVNISPPDSVRKPRLLK